MAKGFTVKAKKPKASESAFEWDFQKARELIKGKQLYFVYLEEEFHIHSSKVLYKFVLT